MKKRRKRLRVDRILYCLGILVVFIYLVILGISWIINHNIFKSVKEDNLYMREFPYSSVDNLIRLIDSEPEETPRTSVLNSIKDAEDDTDELDDNEDESDNYEDEEKEHLDVEEISDSEDIDLPMFTPIRRDN
jgi:hypothetical protein